MPTPASDTEMAPTVPRVAPAVAEASAAPVEAAEEELPPTQRTIEIETETAVQVDPALFETRLRQQKKRALQELPLYGRKTFLPQAITPPAPLTTPVVER